MATASKRNGTAAAAGGRECSTKIESVASQGINCPKSVTAFAYAALEDFGMRRISSKQLRAASSGVNMACTAQDSMKNCEGECD